MAEEIPFIGREDELARLDALIRQWGTLQVVCISGPGGIGKTRLLQEVRQRATSFESLILPAKVTNKITIGFVQEFSASEWGEQFVIGIREMTGELGIDLIETDANFDLDKMVTNLDEVIEQAPDAIIVYHGSNEKLRPGLERAIEQGIKVLTFDNGLERVDGLSTRVTQDENEGVTLSVRKLAEDIDYKGKIGAVWRRDLAPLQERKKLLDNALRQYPDIELVAEYGTSADNITEDIHRQTKNIIRNQPDIQAIWAPWDEFARGVVQALIEENRIDVSVYSFDLNPTDINLITQANSPWKATAATNPQEVGRIMVRLATQAVYGDGIKRRYAIPMQLITQEMLKDLIADEAPLWSGLEIGWTPWLRTLAARDQSSSQSNLLVTEIFDFDDRTLHSTQSFGFQVAQSLDKIIFEPYLDALREWRAMQRMYASQEILVRQKRILRQTFIDCFNESSAQQRVVMLWDTTDPLDKTDVLDELIKLIPDLKNVLLLIAGRNADDIGKLLQERIDRAAQIMALPPLETDASKLYLKRKQDLLHISLEPDLAQKILLLAQGRPILIDLAIEWISRSIPLPWLTEYSLSELEQIVDTDADNGMSELQQEFEAQLVRHISKIRRPMDRLILTMSRIYPLDVEMIAKLLRVSETDAADLFKTAQNYVFVKHLPDGRISLHDEMRRMVLDYVWPEVDKDGNRQRRDSNLAIEYYELKIQSLTTRIQQLKDKGMVGGTAIAEEGEELQTFVTLETLERDLWSLKEQLLIHTLVVDVNEGMKAFVTTFDDATSNYRFSVRPKLIAHAKKYYERLSPIQRYELDSRTAQCSFDEGEYAPAQESATQALAGETESPEQIIDMLILRGNAAIRLGSVDNSIVDFKQAVELSQSHNLPKWLIKAKNGLGWAYRLTGNLELATNYYRQAKNLCQQTGIFEDDYGWILNNLTFALAYQNYRNAIDFGRAAVEYWRTQENKVGLGAAFLVLGTTYHRNGRFHQAEEAFQQAIQIFEPLQLREWLAQAYSDLGSTHLRLNKLDIAEVELKNALEIGPPNLKAMTLNRLGRLYLAKREMPEAEKYLRQSYDRINETIDFGYSFGALAKLIVIAAKTEQYKRLEEFKQALANWKDRVRTYDQHDLGDAYFGLAALALRLKEIETTANFLTEGITLVTGSGGNGRANVLSKLSDLEQYFDEVGADVVQQIGNSLKNTFIKKEANDVRYGAVTTIMICKWANWQEREN